MDTPWAMRDHGVLSGWDEKGPRGHRFEEEMKGRRLFLVRHGEIRQHREKIFLGQTDVPLSDTGRLQAENAAEKLLRHGVYVSRIYTSDLSRAAETAAIIRDGLNRSFEETDEAKRKQKREAREVESISGLRGIEVTPEPREIEVIPEPGFREMSLGEWDGRYISEIREEYPEEYLRRGNSLLTWKSGNDGENFYDLQYRVMKSFRNILERERNSDHSGGRARRPEDLVIVSHSGVINVIVSNLLRKDLAEQIKTRIPNGGMVQIDETGIKENKKIGFIVRKEVAHTFADKGAREPARYYERCYRFTMRWEWSGTDLTKIIPGNSRKQI
jgi:broad specificity phosphatase PhoE